MSAIAEQYQMPSYPRDELTYIYTIEGRLNIQHERTDWKDAPLSDAPFIWEQFNYDIRGMFHLWTDKEYDIIGDGTFEYPSLAKQEEIKQEVVNHK